MKKEERKTLATKTIAELTKTLSELMSQLSTLRLEKRAGKLSNTAQVKLLADDVARVKTVLRLKTLAEEIRPVEEPKTEKKAAKPAVKKETKKTTKKTKQTKVKEK